MSPLLKNILKKPPKAAVIAAKCLGYLLCVGICCGGLLLIALGNPGSGAKNQAQTTDHIVMDRYEKYITNAFSDTLAGILSIKKVYWLSDNDMVAPKPDPACYGQTEDPKALQPILDQAADLIDGQNMVFSTDVKLRPKSVIRYYYDPTILVITWQEQIDGSVYTMGEVKIADASQFRRFLSNGQYSSGSKYLTSEMAKTVNAVLASNGDYYGVRQIGTVVYNGELLRMEGANMDSCYIDDAGDLHFLRAGQITKRADMEQYIADNHIRFSISFGPILVENGKTVPIKSNYCVGEVSKFNERAALCQTDSLHYLLVFSNPNPNFQVLWKFAERLQEMGAVQAYNLDGGRSGTIVLDGERLNEVDERKLSDIIYFATAIGSE